MSPIEALMIPPKLPSCNEVILQIIFKKKTSKIRNTNLVDLF